MKIIAVPLIAVSFVASLAFAESDSAVKNRWETIGVNDGQTGHHLRAKPELTLFGKLSDKEFAEYRKGYIQGQAVFCEPETAYLRGRKGVEYMGQCAGISNEDEVVSRWLDGLKLQRTNRLAYTSTD